MTDSSSSTSFYERVWKVLAEINAAVGSGLPCHRVVNRHGALTGARFFETPSVMEERLRSEGVAFEEDGTVNLDAHLWLPKDGLPPAHEFLEGESST